MAIIAPPYTGKAFDDYYHGRLGLTKDLSAIQLYYDALKKTKAVSQNIVNNLGKILKFNWEPYFDKAIPVKVSREDQPRKAKIIGFLNYGKVFLQDIENPETHLIANPAEIIKTLRGLQ